MDLRYVIVILILIAGVLRFFSAPSHSVADWEPPVIRGELGQSLASAEFNGARYQLKPQGRFSLNLHFTEVMDGRILLEGDDIGLAAFVVGAFPLGGMEPLYRASFSSRHRDGIPSRSFVMPATVEVRRQLYELMQTGNPPASCLRVSGSSVLVQSVRIGDADVTELYLQTQGQRAGSFGEAGRVVIFDRMESLGCKSEG